jgi:succinyl-CoA synthetase alpha subunit
VSILVDAATRVLVQGITGWQARQHVPHMIAYGTNVVAGVSPGKGGERVADRPVFDAVDEVVDALGPCDASVIFARGRDTADAALEAIDAGVKLVLMLAEGVPFRDTMQVTAAATAAGALVVGPNSQGIISPGKAKLGGTGGDWPQRLFSPGRVGVVSRSGGMGQETCWLLSRHGIGQSTYVAIGGELLNGCGFVDIARRFDEDPETDVVVVFGEPGTEREEGLAEAVAAGLVRKPVVAFVPGTFVESRGSGLAFGHAGAVVHGSRGAPSAKRALLAEAGVLVAERWSEIPRLVAEALAEPRPASASQEGTDGDQTNTPVPAGVQRGTGEDHPG